jgi:hypothetical protein
VVGVVATVVAVVEVFCGDVVDELPGVELVGEGVVEG